MAWEVHWTGSGLQDLPRPLELRLQNWGEWSRADSLFLRNVQANVTLASEETTALSRMVLPAPTWDGLLDVRYQMAMMAFGSEARSTYGLMPWFGETYGQGFTSNTLMELYANGSPVEAVRKVTFRVKQAETPAAIGSRSAAPPPMTIISGWGPPAENVQEVTLDHPLDNTAVLFGIPRNQSVLSYSADSAASEIPIEVTQFGGGPELAAELAPRIQRMLKSFAETTQLAPQSAIRVALTETGGGGVNVAGILLVGYSAENALRDGALDPGLLMTTAHELYHTWLGNGFVKVQNPQAVWFQEGYTDYLSLWNLGRAGLITEQQFLDRLIALNKAAHASSSLGQVTFTAENVDWRDGNGPNETLAYRGGALLAFFTDLELRGFAQRDLSRIITDFAKQDDVITNAHIKQWYESHQLHDFAAQYLNAPGFPDFAVAVTANGCRIGKRDQAVAYIGIATDSKGAFGVITQLDPQGPAAAAGAQVGDEITGYWPVFQRELKFHEPEAVKYAFGLDKFPLDQEVHLNVRRAGEEISLNLHPNSLSNVAYVEQFEIADMDAFRRVLGWDRPVR